MAYGFASILCNIGKQTQDLPSDYSPKILVFPFLTTFNCAEYFHWLFFNGTRVDKRKESLCFISCCTNLVVRVGTVHRRTTCSHVTPVIYQWKITYTRRFLIQSDYALMLTKLQRLLDYICRLIDLHTGPLTQN